MRRSMSGGIVLALLLGLAMPVQAGDKDEGGSSWLPTWMGGKKKPIDKESALLVTEKTVTPSPADLAASLREKELNAYWRRQEAALRLKTLALQANDEDQIRRIDQLMERIWTVYLKRTARLSGSPAGSEFDEALLERNLGTTRQPDLLGEAGRGEAAQTANLGGTKR